MDTVLRPPPRATLLIVEDAILSAMALRDELEDAGYKVLDLTRRHHEALAAATLHRPALALVNIELQGHDDGIDLAVELQEIGVPVVFISGQSSRASSARTAAIASFPKPYDAAKMVLAVDYLLGHLQGDESRPRPGGLEVFDHRTKGKPAPEVV